MVASTRSRIEKFTHHRAMAGYETLIRKLAHRVERLEGLQRTPMHGDPGVARVDPDLGRPN